MNEEPISGTFTRREWSQMMAAIDIFATGSRVRPEEREQLRRIRDRILTLLATQPAGDDSA